MEKPISNQKQPCELDQPLTILRNGKEIPLIKERESISETQLRLIGNEDKFSQLPGYQPCRVVEVVVRVMR